MIYHIRDEEKKVISKLIEQVKGLENEVLELPVFYKEIEGKTDVQIINDQLLKLMKKGRLNITIDKTIYSFKVSIGDVLSEEISVYPEYDEKGNFYLVSRFNSSYIKEKCDSYVYTKDNVVILNLSNIVNRIMFKLSEIVARVALLFETDKETLAELEAAKKNLRWYDNFNQSEVDKAMKELTDLSVKLNNIKNEYNIEFNFNHELLGAGFKKYRSSKNLIEITYLINDESYRDSLSIIKVDDKYFYEIRLNKFDKYKKVLDIVEVYEQKEVCPYGYERLIRDMIPVFIDTTNTRISELTK